VILSVNIILHKHNISDISLRGLNKTYLGNVYVDGKPVCDDKWDLLDANVACNQLGLGLAISATKNSFFGLAEGDFGIDNVECIGSENSISECEHSPRHNCEKNEAAGVICSSISILIYFIMLNIPLIGVDVKQGYVFLDNLPVCSTAWTENNARVACRQMGFSNGTVPDESNSTSPSKHHTMSFHCAGLEQNLLVCPMVDSNCTEYQAQVTCTSMHFILSQPNSTTALLGRTRKLVGPPKTTPHHLTQSTQTFKELPGNLGSTS
jgi:hypothetical protein